LDSCRKAGELFSFTKEGIKNTNTVFWKIRTSCFRYADALKKTRIQQMVRANETPIGIRITIWVGIDGDKIPISQQRINIFGAQPLSRLANQNAPRTGATQHPLPQVIHQ
jgi:hypothetical protein